MPDVPLIRRPYLRLGKKLTWIVGAAWQRRGWTTAAFSATKGPIN